MYSQTSLSLRIAVLYTAFTLSISACTLSFLLFPVILSRLNLPSGNFFSPFILDFEKRLLHYQRSPGAHRKVIIGPSYSVQLGEFGDFANLSISASRPKEHKALLKYCRPETTVFYFVSLLDCVNQDLPERLHVTNSIIRRLYILRMTTTMFSLDDMAPVTEYVTLIDFLKSTQTMDFSNLAIHYKSMLKLHPKMIFVIYPISSVKLGRDMSSFDYQFQRMFSDNDLPYLNMYGIFDDHEFFDFCHLTHSGILTAQELLGSVDVSETGINTKEHKLSAPATEKGASVCYN